MIPHQTALARHLALAWFCALPIFMSRTADSPLVPPTVIVGSDDTSPMHSISSVTYLGHATVLIEMDGVLLLTDPVLRSRVGPLVRLVAVPGPILPKVDAVLISHPHWDHLDPPSLRLLEGDPLIIAPRGTATFLGDRGIRHVQELAPGERTVIGDVVVQATLARHSGFRPPFGPETDCVGFLVRGSQQVYFAGDTDLFPEMRDLGGDLDVALLPVWGWGPILGPGHLDPLRAAESLSYLQPRVAIPIHWGTYCPLGLHWLRPSFLSRPPRDFADLARELAPEVDVRILEPGGNLDVSSPRSTPAD
jgi:L-ascorbate metabolism protein UlaG (beta-lactamase superfamily)